jgi:hypothetical protein
MPRQPLTKDTDFIVGEEKVLVYILAALFFALFGYGLIDLIRHRAANNGYGNFLFIIALLPALLFLQKGRSNNVYIRINKTGIYQGRTLLTRWPNFLKAYITQKETVLSIQDNFILVVEYRKDGVADGFRRKIPLTNTQNKSEEEVMEAIHFFLNTYKIETGIGM